MPQSLTRAVAIVLMLASVAAAQALNLWIDVPFVKQSPEGCGAASLAMVMRYWAGQSGREPGKAADADHIFEQLHSAEGRGIYASAMEKYLREQGFQAFAFSGTWDDLSRHIQKGRPLIVGLKPVKGSAALHYVVVAGIDEQQGIVMFNDPAGRKLTKLDRKTFEQEWKATEQWVLLAVPQSGER